MTSTTDLDRRRPQRSIVIVGVLALVALFVVGALVQVPRVEADLATRVERRLAADGIVVVADFTGQDGTLRCTDPLEDAAQAVDAARDVWGVRTIELAGSCRDTQPGAAPPTANAATDDVVSTTEIATTSSATTAVATTAATPAPTPTTPASTVVTTTTVAAAPLFTAALANGQFVLAGRVNNDLEHLALVAGATEVVAPANVTDQLVVDPTVAAVPAQQFTGMLDLLALMPLNLVAGELGWDGTSPAVRGSYAADPLRAAFGAAATRIGVAADLVERDAATADTAAALEAELNALVAAQPILFDKGSSTISLASLATVQQIAGIAKRYAGVAIAVQGHTDSEGDPARNMTLSEQRAAAVRDFLIGQGVPPTDLTAVGFGVTQPVTDAAGNELPDQSRRVVFAVTTT